MDILDDRYELVERLAARPCCGEDFCDDCGDCLYCYGDDPCYPSERQHLWVVHAEDVAAWRENHPEAKRLQ